MSEVADGPETRVIGRRSLADECAGDARSPSGHELDDLRQLDDADMEVGDECQRAAAVRGPGARTIVPVSAIAIGAARDAPSSESRPSDVERRVGIS